MIKDLRPIIKKNKKGNGMMTLVWFFTALAVILFIGFLMVVGSSIVNWVFDEVVPEVSDLGTIDTNGTSINMTQIAQLTINPINNLVQRMTWVTGVLYVLLLIGSFAIVIILKSSPSKWLIGIYFALAVVLIILAIFISNIYEDFYDGTDDLAIRLKEHTLLSWMILYSPLIFTVIVFVTGIILFSGINQEEYG